METTSDLNGTNAMSVTHNPSASIDSTTNWVDGPLLQTFLVGAPNGRIGLPTR